VLVTAADRARHPDVADGAPAPPARDTSAEAQPRPDDAPPAAPDDERAMGDGEDDWVPL
jgi:hypothetical protein